MTSARHSDQVGHDLRCVLERAKGALMLQFGIGSHEAFALLLSWSHQRGRSVEDLSRVLVHGVVEEEPGTLGGEAQLVRWLEERLTGELPAPGDTLSRGSATGGPARGRHLRS